MEASNPRRALEEIWDPFHAKVRGKEIDLETIYGSAMPAEIFPDLLKFKQIIRNLVDNAVKFTERGRMRLCVKIDKEVIKAVFSNAGIGLADDSLRAICESLRQGASQR